MPKPPDMTEEQWREELDRRAFENARQQRRDRINREGFECNAYEPDVSDTCQYRLMRKTKNRWGHEPCGTKPVIVLEFVGPSNSEGIKVPLCRSCLAKHIKDLIGYLE
jgi:Uma2 family endonuclease